MMKRGKILFFLAFAYIIAGCGDQNNTVKGNVVREIEIPTVESQEQSDDLAVYLAELEKAVWGNTFSMPPYWMLLEDPRQRDYCLDASLLFIEQVERKYGSFIGEAPAGGRIYMAHPEEDYDYMGWEPGCEWDMETDLKYCVRLMLLHCDDGEYRIQIEDESGTIIWTETGIEESKVFFLCIDGAIAEHCVVKWKRDHTDALREIMVPGYTTPTYSSSWLEYKVNPMYPEEAEQLIAGTDTIVLSQNGE